MTRSRHLRFSLFSGALLCFGVPWGAHGLSLLHQGATQPQEIPAIQAQSPVVPPRGGAASETQQTLATQQKLATQQALATQQTGSPSERRAIDQGESLEREDRNVQAELVYRAALNAFPASIDAMVHLAAVLEKEHQTGASIAYWKAAVALRPDLWRLRSSLAAASLENGNNAAAIVLLQPITTEHPESGSDQLNLGAALARSQRFADAAGVYKNAMALADVRDSAQLSLIKALITLSRYSEALPLSESYRNAHPRDYEADSLLGQIYRTLGRRKDAEQELQAALALKPDDRDSQYNLGVVCREEGELDEAVLHLKAAAALRPDEADAHFQLARAYRALNMREPALRQEAIVKSLEQKSASDSEVAVLENQASEAVANRNLDRAIQLYKKVEQLAPDSSGTYFNLSLVYEKQGDRRQERQVLEEAERAGRTPLAPIHNQLGFLDLAEGRIPEAKVEFEEVLAENPQSVEALGNSAILSARAGDLPDATRKLELAIETDPKYEKGYVNLGLVLASQGERAKALAMLEHAVALDPSDAVAHNAIDQLRQFQVAGGVHATD